MSNSLLEIQDTHRLDVGWVNKNELSRRFDNNVSKLFCLAKEEAENPEKSRHYPKKTVKMGTLMILAAVTAIVIAIWKLCENPEQRDTPENGGYHN